MEWYRRPAVAGRFYPGQERELRKEVEELLGEAASDASRSGAGWPDSRPFSLTESVEPSALRPKALIAPHAGYVYSGPVAASGYALLAPLKGSVQRVILLGPAHRWPFQGLAVSSAAGFDTPLGRVSLDHEVIGRALELPQVVMLDEAHEGEHSLEVHLPFLQTILGGFTLVPLLVGDAAPEEVAEVLRLLWGGPETLVVISSDLSHYLPYSQAVEVDELTARAIEALRPEEIREDQACGMTPMGGLLLVAREKGLQVKRVDLRNSGDTAGPRNQVVGYGSFLFA
jgi:AmmeMemoRadiSam system protein B